MKILFVNCRQRNEYGSDLHSEHMGLKKKENPIQA